MAKIAAAIAKNNIRLMCVSLTAQRFSSSSTRLAERASRRERKRITSLILSIRRVVRFSDFSRCRILLPCSTPCLVSVRVASRAFVGGFRKFANLDPQFLHVPLEPFFPAFHPLSHPFFPTVLANHSIGLAPQDEVDRALAFLLSH